MIKWAAFRHLAHRHGLVAERVECADVDVTTGIRRVRGMSVALYTRRRAGARRCLARFELDTDNDGELKNLQALAVAVAGGKLN